MGHLRCPTPREHQVARPPGARTGRAVPDYRSQAKHRRRARQGRVTPRLELMTLEGTVDRPLNSDTDRGSWGLCSCVGTDRDDQGKTTPAHITDAGQGDDLLSGSRADNHSADSLLSNEPYRVSINAGGDYWPSHSQSS